MDVNFIAYRYSELKLYMILWEQGRRERKRVKEMVKNHLVHVIGLNMNLYFIWNYYFYFILWNTLTSSLGEIKLLLCAVKILAWQTFMNLLYQVKHRWLIWHIGKDEILNT